MDPFSKTGISTTPAVSSTTTTIVWLATIGVQYLFLDDLVWTEGAKIWYYWASTSFWRIVFDKRYDNMLLMSKAAVRGRGYPLVFTTVLELLELPYSHEWWLCTSRTTNTLLGGLSGAALLAIPLRIHIAKIRKTALARGDHEIKCVKKSPKKNCLPHRTKAAWSNYYSLTLSIKPRYLCWPRSSRDVVFCFVKYLVIRWWCHCSSIEVLQPSGLSGAHCLKSSISSTQNMFYDRKPKAKPGEQINGLLIGKPNQFFSSQRKWLSDDFGLLRWGWIV